MAIYIPSDHTIFLLKEKIEEIRKNFLLPLGFSYFQYLRCFDDGSLGLLTNDTRLIEYCMYIENEPIVYSSFHAEYHNLHSYWFLWDDALPKMPVELAREKFSIRNGLTLVRRNKHYYDMIAVALPEEHPHPHAFYLNKLGAIEYFIHTFDRDHKDLIHLMDQHKISLPKPYRDINYEQICLKKGKIDVYGRQGLTYLTIQEINCLKLLTQGLSYKETAKILNISPKTVETYLHRATKRTGFDGMNEIKWSLANISNN